MYFSITKERLQYKKTKNIMMKWNSMEDSRTETQKMADLLDYRLIFDDDIINDLEFSSYIIKYNKD